jgi:hypothetical protein
MAGLLGGVRGLVIVSVVAGGVVYALGGFPTSGPASTGTAPSASSAQTTQATTEPGSDTHKEGDQFLVGYTGYAVWRSWWSTRLTTNRFLNQPPNAKYLFVALSVLNNDTKARDVPPFKLVDEQGAEYDADARGYMLPGSIGLIETLNPSVSKLGFVVFDVPPDKHYRLKLSGGFWSAEDAFVILEPAPSMPKHPLERLERLAARQSSK